MSASSSISSDSGCYLTYPLVVRSPNPNQKNSVTIKLNREVSPKEFSKICREDFPLIVEQPIKIKAKIIKDKKSTSSFENFKWKTVNGRAEISCDYPIKVEKHHLYLTFVKLAGLVLDEEGYLIETKKDVAINGILIKAGPISDEDQEKLKKSIERLPEVHLKIEGCAWIKADFIFEKCIGHVTLGSKIIHTGNVVNDR